MFSTRWAVRFLVISLILALTIGIAAASDTTSSTAVVEATAAPHKCPLAEKCPWYEEHAREHTAAGCPVTEKCPYYKQHKGDKTVEDVVQEKEHHCPLSEKCPYYKQVKSGEAAKVVKVDSADCPIASKCPYYEKVKTNSEKLYDCPVMHGCPHYKQGDAHTNSGDASKCPHLAKKSAVPELAKQKAADAEDVLAAEAGKDEKSGCPLAEKCPWYEKAKSKDGKAAGCPVNENCPYYKQHKGDHTTDEVLSDSTKPCPLAEKCPYYKDAKNGKVDPAKVDSSGCPVASKCPYYETVKTDPSKQKDCPVAHACPKYKEGGKPAVHGDTSKCPHFAKRAAAQAEDAAAASEVKHACPLAEKCPWYEAHAKDHKAAGCPVTEKCPYYKQHKGDHTTDEALSDPNHHCPMANCPYYKDIKDGKPENVNWTAENCPIASNCPYYKTFKSSDAKHHDCPVLHACPKMKDSDKKFKKLAISGDKAKCPHFAKQADAKDEERADVIHKCPHLAAQKRSSAEADEKKHGCPLAEKCPWYETHAKEHGKAGCPVNEKCPYYKQHKADHNVEDVLTDKTHHCPLAEKCPFYKKVKDGKPDDTNYSATNCPIAEQCPYYKTYKSDDSKHHDCPVLHDCPHFHKRAATASSSDDEKPPKAQEADAPSTVGTKIKETRITDEL
ncbi:hypothetical protein HK102_000145 [Quaeritorhiza haematococci]|nr:hypothetical protein HK102_000145 [Quaeritorhiza haematococci]